MYPAKLTLSELARANGMHEEELVPLRKHNIIEPCTTSDDGAELFDIVQSRGIDMACKLTSVGIDLDTVARIREHSDMQGLHGILKGRVEKLRKEIERLEHTAAFAERLLAECGPDLGHLVLNQTILEYLPERAVISFSLPDELRVNTAPHTNDAGQWEWTTRLVKRELAERGLPPELFHNVGYVITQSDFDRSPIPVDRVFVQLPEAYRDLPPQVDMLPAGHYLTTYVSHAYPGDTSGTGRSTLRQMLAYAQAKGYEIVGDYHEESICRWPQAFDERGKILVHSCLPVRAQQHTG